MAKVKVTLKGIRNSLFHDLYYRMVKASWTKFFVTAALFYIFINFIFALLYHFSPAEIVNARPDSLWDSFIFSFQTSTTIGYGYLVPKSNTAHFLVIADALSGIFYVAIITGMAFTKFARPSAKILFTDNIILAHYDGQPTLMFRIANGRDTDIVDASVKVSALISYTSLEGHEMRRNYSLSLLSNENPTFNLTWTVMHQITEESPLFGMNIEQMKEKRITFFTSFTGIDSILSQTIYDSHRYSSSRLIVAKKFKDILLPKSDTGYELNYENFNLIEENEYSTSQG